MSKKRPCIFFDLDGTLLDSRKRLFELFQFLVPATKLDFNGYWDLKRKQISHGEILTRYFNYSNDEIRIFEKQWFMLIEDREWLKYDVPFDWVENLLNKIQKKYMIFIVTSRQSEKRVNEQLSAFNWKNYLHEVFVTKQKKEKHELIKSVPMDNIQSWIIGDTGTDIQAGKILNINTAGVLSGFRNKEILLRYNPDLIIENASMIEDFLYI